MLALLDPAEPSAAARFRDLYGTALAFRVGPEPGQPQRAAELQCKSCGR